MIIYIFRVGNHRVLRRVRGYRIYFFRPPRPFASYLDYAMWFIEVPLLPSFGAPAQAALRALAIPRALRAPNLSSSVCTRDNRTRVKNANLIANLRCGSKTVSPRKSIEQLKINKFNRSRTFELFACLEIAVFTSTIRISSSTEVKFRL